MNAAIRLEGAANFRDIGGCLTADGHRVKKHCLYRSGELSHLTDADVEQLKRLRIPFVADLRAAGEAQMLRTRWPEAVVTETLVADIQWNPNVNGRSMLDALKSDPTPHGANEVMVQTFRQLPMLCGPVFRQIADRLDNGVSPILFHCTNGRDRTGIVSALLLYLLGATKKAIVADFLKTNECIDVAIVVANTHVYIEKMLGVTLDDETVKLCTFVQPHYLDETFATLANQYGSVEEFFLAFGIDAGLQTKIRGQLLEPA